MSRRYRALLALLLLVTLPLRAMAALAMPCCPMADHGDRPDMSMAMPDAHSSEAPDHATPSHTTFDCCAFAMMAVPAVRIVAAPCAAPFAAPATTRPEVAFVTDAPERPPRAATAVL